VEDIRSIDWSALPFDSLTIPAQKKEVIMAVTQSRMGQLSDDLTEFADTGSNLRLKCQTSQES
jgi:hypothetical protein